MATLRQRYRDALWDSDLGKHELWVALALEKFMSSKDLGGAYPSVETLCRYSRLGERTVQRSLRKLVQLRWIKPTRPANQHRPTTYQGCLPGTPKTKPGVSATTPRGVHQAPDPYRDPKRAALLESAAAYAKDNRHLPRRRLTNELWDRFPDLKDGEIAELVNPSTQEAA